MRFSFCKKILKRRTACQVCSCLIFFLVKITPVSAQDTEKVEWLQQFCQPGLEGMTPGKGLVFEHSNTPRFRISSVSDVEGLEPATDNVENYRRVKLKMRFPLWLSDGLKVIGGFRYEQEEMIFQRAGHISQGIHNNLKSSHLKVAGGEINVLKPFIGNKYFVFRGAVRYSGQFKKLRGISSDYMTYNLSALYGIKKNSNTELGFGINFNNGFGFASIYPVMLYNHNFNDKWGIEALLPKQVKLRRNLPGNNIFALNVELEGGRYLLPEVQLSATETGPLTMEMAEIKTGISFQRPLIAFLWFGMEAGYRKNLNLGFVRPHTNRNDNIIRSDLTSGIFANISLFVTPPKSLSKKK